jgi:hypothetical protein
MDERSKTLFQFCHTVQPHSLFHIAILFFLRPETDRDLNDGGGRVVLLALCFSLSPVSEDSNDTRAPNLEALLLPDEECVDIQLAFPVFMVAKSNLVGAGRLIVFEVHLTIVLKLIVDSA